MSSDSISDILSHVRWQNSRYWMACKVTEYKILIQVIESQIVIDMPGDWILDIEHDAMWLNIKYWMSYWLSYLVAEEQILNRIPCQVKESQILNVMQSDRMSEIECHARYKISDVEWHDGMVNIKCSGSWQNIRY